MNFEDFAKIELVDESSLSDIEVSVVCLTYNQKEYICDALNGFIMQDTSFNYEIIIFDDASNDGTTEIIRAYQKNYPELFKLYIAHINTYNDGSLRFLRRQYIYSIPCGKYIACCEGDDYWIDKHKLQKQFDILTNNNELNLCAHNSIIHDCYLNKISLGSDSKTRGIIPPGAFICKDNVNIQTSSIMIKKELVMLPEEIIKYDFGDYQLIVNAGLHGQIYYIPDVMSVYRFMTHGSWSERVRYNDNMQIRIKHFLDFIALLEYLKNNNEQFYIYFVSMQTFYLWNIVEVLRNRGLMLKETTNSIVISKAYDILEIIDNFTKYVSQIKNLLKRYKKIYIMGAGKYGKLAKQAFDDNSIFFDGFVVSSLDQEYYVDGKLVQKISSINDKIKSDVFIFIAIGGNHKWYKIKEVLMSNDLKNYLWPFGPFVYE